ncbi:hypothetical protein [Hyalangium rubrum]|uniref:Lipoprotein n=1 Tax=Hyalangium rubrum TaxID=3103134 RepID=A0ABU5GXF7_9BACT|nr:hypothetical protein [Hyalangium sp. s54d21]MDY7225878.1 hypothetical protein [Hyalangium sp. s54d21]
MTLTSRLGSTALLLVAALALSTGCAANRRDAYLHDKAREHVYRKPINEVWPEVKAMLAEEEFSIMEAQGGYELQTDWVMEGAPSSLGTSWARYLVRGIEKGPGQSAVQFHKQARVQSQPPNDGNTGYPAEGIGHAGTDSNTLSRDHAMEWKLLQRVDAEAAKALEAEAAQKVQP